MHVGQELVALPLVCQGEAPTLRRVCQFGLSPATFELAQWMLTFAEPPLEESEGLARAVWVAPSGTWTQIEKSKKKTIDCELWAWQELEINDLGDGMFLAERVAFASPSPHFRLGQATVRR